MQTRSVRQASLQTWTILTVRCRQSHSWSSSLPRHSTNTWAGKNKTMNTKSCNVSASKRSAGFLICPKIPPSSSLNFCGVSLTKASRPRKRLNWNLVHSKGLNSSQSLRNQLLSKVSASRKMGTRQRWNLFSFVDCSSECPWQRELKPHAFTWKCLPV